MMSDGGKNSDFFPDHINWEKGKRILQQSNSVKHSFTDSS